MSSSRRQSLTPYVPGAWPCGSKDHRHEEDPQDADVSSVSSYGSILVRKESYRKKTRRRWTFTGPARSYGYVHSLPSPICTNSGPLNTSNSSDVKMSPLTDATESTAMSSPLNTPDLTEWPTGSGAHSGGGSLLFSSIAPAIVPTPVVYPGGLSQAHQDDGSGSVCLPRLSPSVSKQRLPPPHLDPPLLNFIPGLSPLKLPVPEPTADYLYPGSTPTYLSPSEACSTRPTFLTTLPGKGLSSQPSALFTSPSIATNFFPVAEVQEPSPQLTVSSFSMASEGDSPVLPPGNVNHTADPAQAHLDRSSSSVPEMDAFALAAAVALSNSRTSLSIPSSVRSVSAQQTIISNTANLPNSDAYRRPSDTTETEASTGHRETLDFSGETPAIHKDTPVAEHVDSSRARPLSAPQPVVWQNTSPRTQPVRTISSRVDVGEAAVARRKPEKQPVLGKVRKFGERIRGLFKSRGDAPTKGAPGHTGTTAEYNLMTTTTAVTNVEYELVMPEPLPSPRAKNLRNHRRSLPLPSLLPSGVDRMHPNITSRGTPGSSHELQSQLASSPHNPAVGPNEAIEGADRDPSIRDIDDPSRSPRTPKARHERMQTAPQISNDSEHKPLSERKARRFSLSSKIDSFRTTVKPRPPLPALAAVRPKDNARASCSGPASVSKAGPSSVERGGKADITPERERFWGGELPNVLNSARESRAAHTSNADSPARSRTQTAPPHLLIPQSDVDSSTQKDKRSRRFSLSSYMTKRQTGERSSPGSLKKTRRLSRRRPRGDTVTTITHDNVHFDMVSPRPDADVGRRPVVVDVLSPEHRLSMVPSIISSTAESTYYDAREQISEDGHSLPTSLERSCSPAVESDLDSMSFARTPDHSSGTLSFGSSTEREYHLQASESSTSGSYSYRSRPSRGYASTSAVSQLVGESASTPIVKTLRFSPSLTLSFDMSCSDVDYGDEDEIGRLEREEELSFMRALGFEFDEIARRVREEP